MEYADGGDLRIYLEENFSSFDWDKKYQLAIDITNGLHYIHKENILHRDLVGCFYFLQKIFVRYCVTSWDDANIFIFASL